MSVAVTATEDLIFMSQLIVIFAGSLMWKKSIIELHAIAVNIFFLYGWVMTLLLVNLLDLICLIDVLKE